jgi:hypothetical protein
MEGDQMKAPPIYLVVENSGDGYHAFSPTFEAWFFDSDEAHEHAKKLQEERGSEYKSFDVEEVPGG